MPRNGPENWPAALETSHVGPFRGTLPSSLLETVLFAGPFRGVSSPDALETYRANWAEFLDRFVDFAFQNPRAKKVTERSPGAARIWTKSTPKYGGRNLPKWC